MGPGESAHLELLRCLAGFPAACQIVVSGCEASSTPPLKTPVDGIAIHHVAGPASRAAQLNRGVDACTARCLWLLHADSRPTPQAMERAAAFARTCDKPGWTGTLGWFPLSFGADGPRVAALNAAFANLRSRFLCMPFGDQAWLLTRDLFDAVGGFDEQFGRGEDLDFIRRARRAGVRLRRMDAVVATSARRYREHGWLRTTLAHLWLTLRLSLKSRRKSRRISN